MSVDPARDTPARLKAYAAKFQSKNRAKPGWVWLTGDKPVMDEVLKGVGAYTADYTQHPAQVLVGDASRGAWTRLYGFLSPERIQAKIDELLAARQTRQQ